MATSKGSDMTVDYSKFAPTEFLPKLGINCPHPDDLKTGDLLFPRTREVEDQAEMESSQNLGSDWLSRMALHLENSNDKTLLVDVISDHDQQELIGMLENPQSLVRQSLDMTEVIAELLDEKIKKIPVTANNNLELNIGKLRNIFESNNSLYSSHGGLQKLKKILATSLQQTEGLGDSIDDILKDQRLIKIIIRILLTANFGVVVKEWFNRDLSPKLYEFMRHPIVQLLFDLLLSDDVRSNVFVGHVGIVIRENDNVYVIEDNITSYSHYRVAIHPYYVQKEHHVDDDLSQGEVCKYLNKYYNVVNRKYDLDNVDLERPAAQATGWVNRRAAMLASVWHARPTSSGFPVGWEAKLTLTAKALHGRPFGFFDQPILGNDDRMYCAEYVYNVFRNGVSQTAADNMTDKLKWKYIKAYLQIVNNTKMLDFVNNILGDTNFPISPERNFFVLPPAILWNSSGLTYPSQHPGGPNNSYAPILPELP